MKLLSLIMPVVLAVSLSVILRLLGCDSVASFAAALALAGGAWAIGRMTAATGRWFSRSGSTCFGLFVTLAFSLGGGVIAATVTLNEMTASMTGLLPAQSHIGHLAIGIAIASLLIRMVVSAVSDPA
jgi:hypothetical protein